MYAMFGYLTAALDGTGRRLRGSRGQATVEYVGLIVVLGAGLGLVVTSLDALGFATKVGAALVKGIAGALAKVIP